MSSRLSRGIVGPGEMRFWNKADVGLHLPGMDYASSRKEKLSNENLSARHRISSYDLLVKEAPRVPRTKHSIVIVLGCSHN